MAERVLHQYLEGVSRGDATSDHAFLIRDWLHEFGFKSEIYTNTFQAEFEDEVHQFAPGALKSDELVIYHHTIGSPSLNQMISQHTPLLMIYHNITPPAFFESADPALARKLEVGRRQLQEIRPFVRLALGASPYSQEELIGLGYENTGVLPIVLKESNYRVPLDVQIQEKMSSWDPTILFVGRVVPNKCQEDLVKLLYHLRQHQSNARLVLVGDLQEQGYVRWLEHFIRRYGMAGAVTLAGHVSQQEMVTYYKTADLFVSMSEHEGFGKPLIESMYFGLPIMAYSAAAVPSTLGGAGILFTRKEFEPLSEMVQILQNDHQLRHQVVETQLRRVQAFLEPTVKERFRKYLVRLELLK